MNVNDLIQWICVGVILLVVAIAVVRHIINMVRWSRRVRNESSLPPCCSGKSHSKSVDKSAANDSEAHDKAAHDKAAPNSACCRQESRQSSCSTCDVPGCPLSGSSRK